MALSPRADVGRANPPTRRGDHARTAVRAAAPGIAVSLDGGNRSLEGIARGRYSHRADDLRRARKPAQDRARQGRPDHQGDRRGGTQRDCRHCRSQGAPVPVRESARGLGRRSGTLPRHGAGIPEGVIAAARRKTWMAGTSPAMTEEGWATMRFRWHLWHRPAALIYERQAIPVETMQWTDEGIVLGVKRHGEANAILELMTREHGRHLGLVRGGAGSRLRPILQPGNRVNATWRARLDEHLGHYVVEGLDLPAAGLFGAAHAVYGVARRGALCRLVPERDPHPHIHAALEEVLACLIDARQAGPHVVRFELQLLAELGFGLDLDRCAATGVTDELTYVSPRSG